MPELPEVEYVVRTLRDTEPSLIGRRIEQAHVLSENVVAGSLETVFCHGLQGSTFTSVSRLGKYIICGLDSGSGSDGNWLVIHLRMTGRLYLVSGGEALGQHTRLSISLDQGWALHFDDPRKFGRVWLTPNPLDITGKLGPDALAAPRDTFFQGLGKGRRALKPLLLDQGFVCGIGNIYADEILFRAGFHPLTPGSSLDTDGKSRLYATVLSVLQEAVAAGGANIDGVFKAGGFMTAVYGRDGKPCRQCGATILKIRVAQRGTHYCPQCQLFRGGENSQEKYS